MTNFAAHVLVRQWDRKLDSGVRCPANSDFLPGGVVKRFCEVWGVHLAKMNDLVKGVVGGDLVGFAFVADDCSRPDGDAVF